MKRTGLCFYVGGEYVTESDYRPLADPADQNWTPFQNPDLHPFGSRFFTVWSQFSDLTEEDIQDMTETAITVINWLRQERDWCLFNATLWLDRGDDQDRKMHRWHLC